MGDRHQGRKLAIQVMYLSSIRNESLESLVDDFFDHAKGNELALTFGKELSNGAEKYKIEFDKLIENYAVGWTLDRINPIDLNVMRVAFYELIYTNTPYTIVLNEAIEIAKSFSEDESSKFINGILGRYVKEHVQRDN